jgi:hypothetical protein
MPRYFFDVRDGEKITRDDDGLELASLDTAQNEAVKALPEIAKDQLPDGSRREFEIIVKNDAGRPVLRAVLSLMVERLT